LMMLVITVLSVTLRVVLKIPASWTESLAQYSFIFLVFIGSAAVMRDEGHITITFFVDRLSPLLQKLLRIVGRLLILSFVVMFSLGALQATKLNWGTSLPTVSWMRISYMYMVLFASGVIMTFYLLLNLYEDIFGRKRDAASTGGST
ncbi:MAG TPA: TRAP transporter small permease, partial [Spirochaetia bacterium]|nr:TRAP transporter small permease [Spirochaetia bacterium]